MDPIHSLRKDRNMKNHFLGLVKDWRRRQKCGWCINALQWWLLTITALMSCLKPFAGWDFKTLCGLSSGLKMGLTVPVSLPRESSLNCSLGKLWRLCSLPRQSVPPRFTVTQLNVPFLQFKSISSWCWRTACPFHFAAISMCLKKAIVSPFSLLYSKLCNHSLPVHHTEAKLLLAGDSFQ